MLSSCGGDGLVKLWHIPNTLDKLSTLEPDRILSSKHNNQDIGVPLPKAEILAFNPTCSPLLAVSTADKSVCEYEGGVLL